MPRGGDGIRREWILSRNRATGFDLALASFALLAVGFVHRDLMLDSGRHDSVREVVDAALYDPTTASPGLGLLVFGALMLRRRGALVVAYREGPPRLVGGIALAVAFALLVWSRQIAASHLVMPSLILLAVGVALLLGGGRLLRVVSLPLLALLLTTPLPAPLAHQLVFPMQLGTVASTSLLLDLLGQAHSVFGDLLVKDGVTFQVIEGCSGLKSTLSLGLAALLYADLTLRRSIEKLVVLALVPGIGLLLNAVRVTILVLGEIPAESDEHAAIGIAMVVVGVVLLASMEVLLTKTVFASRSPAPDDSTVRSTATPGSPIAASRMRFVAAALIVGSLGVESMPPGVWPPPRPAIAIDSLPESIDDWRARGVRADKSFLGSVWFQHRIYRAYDRQGDTVRIFVGHEDLSDLDRSGFSPKTAIPGSGWLSIRRLRPLHSASSGTAEEDFGLRERLVVEYPRRRTLVLHWRIGFAPWGQYLVERWLGWSRLAHAGDRLSPLVLRIETDVSGPDGDDRAWLMLRQFADRVDEWAISVGVTGKNAQYLRVHPVRGGPVDTLE